MVIAIIKKLKKKESISSFSIPFEKDNQFNKRGLFIHSVFRTSHRVFGNN
jgi:hypothetical protein